jgi:hypothetical protein
MIAFVFAAMWRNRIEALVWGEAVPVSRKKSTVLVALISLLRENQGRQAVDVFIMLGMKEEMPDRGTRVLLQQKRHE